MLYTIKNDILTVEVSDRGAELYSVKRGECEYIWVGDEKFWEGRAPLCFPVCGRFYETKYSYKGDIYSLGTHGFLRNSTLSVAEQTETSICFALSSNEETKKGYPFDFLLKVWYILEGDKLINRFEVINTGKEVLPATVGGHPGFNVPLDGKGSFEDYYVEFENECSPDELILSAERCLVTGNKRYYPLENGKIIRLRHSLFDIDAVFLCRTDSSVTLRSDKTERFVKLTYPDMPYLGFWHKPRTNAPYVCIEPWCGLPGYDCVMEDISERPDMFRVSPGKTKTVEFSMQFG